MGPLRPVVALQLPLAPQFGYAPVTFVTLM